MLECLGMVSSGAAVGAFVAIGTLLLVQQIFMITWLSQAWPWTTVSSGPDGVLRIGFTPRLTERPTNATNVVTATTVEVTDDAEFVTALEAVQILCDRYACNQPLGVCDVATRACACNVTIGAARCLGYQNSTNCGCQCPNTTLACQEGPRHCLPCGPSEECTAVGCRPLNCSEIVCPSNATCIDGHCTCNPCRNRAAACGPGAINCTNVDCKANCTCNAYSALGPDGKCACLTGYTGADCSQCAGCTVMQNATCPSYSIGCILGPAFPNCTLVECLCPPSQDSILCPTCTGKPCDTTLCGTRPSLIASCTYLSPGGVCTPNCTCQNGAMPTGPGGTCVCPSGTEFYAGGCYYPVLPTFTPDNFFGFSNPPREQCYGFRSGDYANVGGDVTNVYNTINWPQVIVETQITQSDVMPATLRSLGNTVANGPAYLAAPGCATEPVDGVNLGRAALYTGEPTIGSGPPTFRMFFGPQPGPVAYGMCTTPQCTDVAACECVLPGTYDPVLNTCVCKSCTTPPPFVCSSIDPSMYWPVVSTFNTVAWTFSSEPPSWWPPQPWVPRFSFDAGLGSGVNPALFDDNMLACSAPFDGSMANPNARETPVSPGSRPCPA